MLPTIEGEFYREALQMSRLTREMFCLMEGRHVHPSTLYPGGVGTIATVQLFTDYLTRLMKYVEFMKRVVPMHDDLFDFFYQALPGYEKVGERRVLLTCWGCFNDPDHCNFQYKDMTAWGRKMFVTPGIVADGKLVTNDLVKINLGIRILLGSSFYDDWQGQETFVTHDPLGNPVDRRHPWNQHTLPHPQKRNFDGKDHLAMDTGGGPLARLWSTALSGLVVIGFVKATGHSVVINLPRTALKPAATFEWKIPKWSTTIERDRARTYFQAYAAGCALHFVEKALAEVRAGHSRTWEKAEQLVRSLIELYGSGLERMIAIVAEGAAGTAIVERLADDELVASLLILHGLHPVALETRIERALEKVRPYLGSHAGGVEFLGVDDDGMAYLRLEGTCKGCPSSTITVKLAIERAVLEAAPEIVGIAVEGVTEEKTSGPQLIPIESIQLVCPVALPGGLRS